MAAPRTLALDTAILGTWARHWAAGSADASRLTKLTEHSGLRVLLTLQHLMELAAHGSDSVIRERARFLRALGPVFWLRSASGTGPGTALDLTTAEISAHLHSPEATFSELVAMVRPNAFAFGDATVFADLLCEPSFTAYARARIEQRRVTASLERTQIADPRLMNTPLDPRAWTATLQQVSRNFDDAERHLATELRTKGDRRLGDPGQVASEFFVELNNIARSAASDGQACLADALRLLLIAESDLQAPITGEALAEKYIWHAQSRVIARMGALRVEDVREIRRSSIPSLELCTQLERARRGAPRADGGDFYDSTLACLSLYASVTSVDKRTYEYLRQIKRNIPAIRSLIGTVVRLPDMASLETLMSNDSD